MSVLDPRELQASPLADLHALASELGLEGFRRLRKADLIEQIMAVQGGGPAPEPDVAVEAEDEVAPALEAAAPADAEPVDAEASLYGDAASWGGQPAGEYTAPGAYASDEDVHEGATAEVPRDYQTPMPNWEQEQEQEQEAEPEEPADAGAERDEDVRGGVLDVLPNGSGFI